jgi:hypothetical protein
MDFEFERWKSLFLRRFKVSFPHQQQQHRRPLASVNPAASSSLSVPQGPSFMPIKPTFSQKNIERPMMSTDSNMISKIYIRMETYQGSDVAYNHEIPTKSKRNYPT